MSSCCEVKVEDVLKKRKKYINLEKLLVYQPLFLIIIFSGLMAFSVTDTFSIPVCMGFVFLFLSYLKAIDLRGFVEGFKNYDPVAKKNQMYGYLYPGIELLLGLLLISGVNKSPLYLLGAFILLVTGVGILNEKFLKKNVFSCSCMGAKIKVPLGALSLFENFFMALMLVFLYFS